MTREELAQKKLQWRDDPELCCLGSAIDDLRDLANALEAAWVERDGWKECAYKNQVERPMWIDETHTLRDRMTGKDAEIAALTVDRDAYKFAAERAIGMGTAKAIMHELDALKHRVRELERGEYICKKCGLRKDGEALPGEF